MDPRSPSHRVYLERRSIRVDRLREALETAFPEGTQVTLEIGCGHGHYLSAYAARHPEAWCLGIDLQTRRIVLARQKKEKQALTRVQFLKAEATELLAAWPPGRGLERIFILFPDPWPKKRHHKNRILQPTLLDDLARLSQPGTCLHFRTDHEDNFTWGLGVIASHERWQVDDALEWPFERPSYFQELLGRYQSLTARLLPANTDEVASFPHPSS